SGLGFGFMSGAFSVVNILADSVGPGTIGIHGDSQHYFLSSDGIVTNDSRYCKTYSVHNPQYISSLVPTYIIMFSMGIWAFYTAGGSLRNLKLCLTCKDKDFLLANHRPR
ncbi:hypothetical protein GOODEAATRI_002039, partial [Goodea atripinnis]